MVNELLFYYKAFYKNTSTKPSDQILKMHNFIETDTDILMLFELAPKCLAERLFTVNKVSFNG